MLNSPILEIAIGLILIYLVLGLLCTSINEFLAQMLSLRAENLFEAIHGLFPGPDRHRIAEDILNHPIVQSLSRKQVGVNAIDPGKRMREISKLPSALPADLFSAIVTDLLGTPNGLAAYDGQIQALLRSIGIGGVIDPATDKAKLESWYSHAMDRAAGWYKRKAQVMSLMVSIGLVFVINADTMTIVDRLSHNPAERAQFAALAAKTTESEDSQDVQAQTKEATLDLLGWAEPGSSDPRRVPQGGGPWVLKIFGLSLTAFAASLGAPFWFDLLSKFMTVRSGGDQPKRSKSK